MGGGGAVSLSQDERMLTLFGANLYYEKPDEHDAFVVKANAYTRKKAAELAGAGVACELHYLKTPEEQRLANIRKRNADITSGSVCGGFLMGDEAFDHVFEEPSAEEADVIVNFGEGIL